MEITRVRTKLSGLARGHPSNSIGKMNALYVCTLLAASVVFAEDPAHSIKKEKALEKILDEKYSAGQLRELGLGSNICKHLDTDHVEAIQSKMSKAHMKLNSKCILTILKENESAFHKLTEDLNGDEKEKKKFFRIHALLFCENTKAFKELDKDEWYKPLDRFCDKYHLEDSRQKLEQERKALEGLKEANGKPNGASAIAASSFVVALVLGAALFL